MLKPMLLTTAFLVEVAMLAAVSVWGVHAGPTLPVRLLLGIGAPLLFAVLWGLFLSPSAAVPVSPGLRVSLKLLLFGLATLALVGASLPTWAAVFAAVALVDLLWLRLLGH